MAMIVYGTHVFTKHMGYYGKKEECPVCRKIYSKGYVRNMVWAHLEYIPLFPVKWNYFKMCPICGRGVEMKAKQAKAEMEGAENTNQKFEVYAKHILAKKPKKLMAADTSYEVWIKDLITGEETCIVSETCKDVVKDIKKERGLKKIEIKDV